MYFHSKHSYNIFDNTYIHSCIRGNEENTTKDFLKSNRPEMNYAERGFEGV